MRLDCEWGFVGREAGATSWWPLPKLTPRRHLVELTIEGIVDLRRSDEG